MKPGLFCFMIAIGLFACPNARSQQTPAKQSHQRLHKPRTFVVDDFPVTDKMFGRCDGCTFKSGPLSCSDIVWFTNKQLGVTLAVSLYTDNFRNAFFLFKNDDIPFAVIDTMELIENDSLATHGQKLKYFHGFLRWGKPVGPKYFISNKGFAIGDSSARAIRIYGKPDRQSVRAGVEVLSWDFIGDILYDGKTDLRGKPLAADSFGHGVIMCFRHDRLIGLIYQNDIP